MPHNFTNSGTVCKLVLYFFSDAHLHHFFKRTRLSIHYPGFADSLNIMFLVVYPILYSFSCCIGGVTNKIEYSDLFLT